MAASQPGMNRFYLALGAGAVAGLAAIVYLVKSPKQVSIPVDVSVLPADTAGFRGYLLGSDSARIEVTEYADFQCPGCQAFELIQFPTIEVKLIQTGIVRWRYRDFPLAQHLQARLAAHAAACADVQGKYREMHRAIYDSQPEWSDSDGASAHFAQLAVNVGLDASAYDACMQSVRYAGRIQASVDEGVRLGVTKTPSFVISGRLYEGLNSDRLQALVDTLLSRPPR